MNQSDLLFLVMITIGLTTLTIVIYQLLRSRNKDNGGEWYEGPWDDDDRRKGPRG